MSSIAIKLADCNTRGAKSRNIKDNPRKTNYKYYQNNDPKRKSYLCKSWLLYNCFEVIDTPAQSPDIKTRSKICLFTHLKKKIRKRSPINKNELLSFIMAFLSLFNS